MDANDLTLELFQRHQWGCTHGQEAVLVLLGGAEGALQGQSVLLGDLLQRPGLTLLHLAGLLLVPSSHGAHVLLVGRLLLAQGLNKKWK